MSKPIKFVFAADSHGDMACEDTLSALYEYCREFKPDIRIAGGDHADLRSLRRGVGSSDAESIESLKEDLDACHSFISRYRATHVLKGNHEYRLRQLALTSSSGVVRDYCLTVEEQLDSRWRKAGAKVILPYHASRGILRIGPGAFGHGYGKSVNLMKQGSHYADRGGFYVCGHGHVGHQVNLEKHGGGAAFMAPCMARIEEMLYSENWLGTSRWNNGWIAGWIDGTDYKVWIIHRVGSGRWHWQSDLRTYTPPKRR